MNLVYESVFSKGTLFKTCEEFTQYRLMWIHREIVSRFLANGIPRYDAPQYFVGVFTNKQNTGVCILEGTSRFVDLVDSV